MTGGPRGNMNPLRRIQSAKQNIEDIESFVGPHPTQSREQGEVRGGISTHARPNEAGQDQAETTLLEINNTLPLSQRHDQQQTLTKITSTIPASMPPLAPTLQTNMGQTVTPLGEIDDNLCSICWNPECQGVQEHYRHCFSSGGEVHWQDACPVGTRGQSSLDDQAGHEGEIIDIPEPTGLSEMSTPRGGWMRERWKRNFKGSWRSIPIIPAFLFPLDKIFLRPLGLCRLILRQLVHTPCPLPTVPFDLPALSQG